MERIQHGIILYCVFAEVLGFYQVSKRVWKPDETLALVFKLVLLKVMNCSCANDPISLHQLGQVHQSIAKTLTPKTHKP